MTQGATIQSTTDDVVNSLKHPLALLVREVLSEAAGHDGIVIDDEENILQALRARVRLRAVLHTGELSHELYHALPGGTPVHPLARRTAKKLFGAERASRTFALADAPAAPTLEDLARRPGDLVVLDGVSLAGNIGAVLRSSAALGAAGVVLLHSPINNLFERRLIRASRGLVFSLPVVAASLESFLDFCQRNDVAVLATSPHAAVPVAEAAFLEHRLAIVLGGEKHGCSPELESAARWRVKIPMSPAVESLNLSAAASILLYCRRHFNAC